MSEPVGLSPRQAKAYDLLSKEPPAWLIGRRGGPVGGGGCLAAVAGVPAGQSKSLMDLAHQTVKGREMRLVEVNGNRNIARLIAQSAVQVRGHLCVIAWY